MTADLFVEHYDWPGGREAMLRFGPNDGPVVVVAQPLFEEANRTRAVVVAMLRGLAERGIGGALPDLPGQGESLVTTRDATLADWRTAFAAAAATLPGPFHVVAIRGGGLVDAGATAASRWHLAPMDGASQARELRRLSALSDSDTGLFAGNDLSPVMLAELEAAAPAMGGSLRVVRLAGDPRPADVTLSFPPPWRTAEPQRDDALAAALANDIARWIAPCAG